jgi:hypothetical protein
MQRGPSRQLKKKRRGLLVFSELPSRPSAGSRSGCSRTSLGCKPRSFMRISLGWFDYLKNARKDNPTPAYSPVSDRWRLTALVEVHCHWARRVQAPMPQISGPNLQKNQAIEACKEEECVKAISIWNWCLHLEIVAAHQSDGTSTTPPVYFNFFTSISLNFCFSDCSRPSGPAYLVERWTKQRPEKYSSVSRKFQFTRLTPSRYRGIK